MNADRCETCGWAMIPHTRWKRMSPTERRQALDNETRSKHGHGVCRACAQRNPEPRNRAEEREARLEDLRWMADTGESLDGAARRLEVLPDTLDRWLARNDKALRSVLLARNPRDHNAIADGSGVTQLYYSQRRSAAQGHRNARRRVERRSKVDAA